LGPYRLRGLLGAGAMGEVYRAWDARLEREVAIKIVSGPGLDREAIDRFTVETRAVAALSHPNIVTIYDVGEIDGRPHAVMELLEGDTLRNALATGPIPAERALSIGIRREGVPTPPNWSSRSIASTRRRRSCPSLRAPRRPSRPSPCCPSPT